MLKIVVLMKRRKGLTPEEYQTYYETKHRLLIKHFSEHVVDYRRTYPLRNAGAPADYASLGGGGGGELEFDGMTEIWVKDQAAMDKIFGVMANPEIARIFETDEANFIDRSTIRLFICDERNICEALGRPVEGKTTMAAV
jgi:hypothetical protein